MCLAMAVHEFAGSAQETGVTKKAEGCVAWAEHLEVVSWAAKLLLHLEVFLENLGPGVL